MEVVDWNKSNGRNKEGSSRTYNKSSRLLIKQGIILKLKKNPNKKKELR